MSLLPNLPAKEQERIEIKQLFERYKGLLEKETIPNAIKLLGHYEPALKVYAELLEGNFKNGKIPALTKQMILLSILNAKGSKHCSIFTSHICQVAGVQEEMLQLLSDDLANSADDLTDAVIKFGVKCATDALHVSDKDYALLSAQGVRNSEIMEIISLAAFTNYLTTLCGCLKSEKT